MRETKEQKQVKISTALDLRLKGMSYREIAKEMGVHSGTAHGYVQVAIKVIQEKYTEKAEALVILEQQKLDRLEVGLIESARKGDIKAATVLLKIMERRAKLLGLDSPAEVKIEAVNVEIKKPEGI